MRAGTICTNKSLSRYLPLVILFVSSSGPFYILHDMAGDFTWPGGQPTEAELRARLRDAFRSVLTSIFCQPPQFTNGSDRRRKTLSPGAYDASYRVRRLRERLMGQKLPCRSE